MKTSLKRFSMFAAAALTLSVSAAYGQNKLVGTVPFEFRVGKTLLPAGTYDVGALSGSGSTHIFKVGDSASGHGILAKATAPIYPTKVVDHARMIFRCSSNGCALSEVWTTGQMGYVFSTPRSNSVEPERMATVYLATPSGE